MMQDLDLVVVTGLTETTGGTGDGDLSEDFR